MQRLWVLIFPVLAYFVGCGSECNGIEVNGRCEKRCEDRLCPTGYACFQNACSAPCSSDGDCSGGRTCERTVSDEGDSGRLCVYASGVKPPDTATGGTEGPCTASSECAERFGYHCVEGECTLTCDVHAHCGASGACTGTARDAEARDVRVCEADEFPRAEGQFGTPCPDGDECDAESDFRCVSAGSGDIDAYCTLRGCGSDAECPTGFFCSESRTSSPPCEEACGLAGQDVEGCIPARDIGPGKAYACGPISLTTRLCLAREFCNECETDADCLGVANQICAKDESGQKICTVLCDGEVNSCPWGSAAVCGLWDQDLGKETCTHRFGSCKGTGRGCEPCVEQSDCPDGFCTQTQFTGERYCVDMNVTCSCAANVKGTCTGGGCPSTPAGKPMTCLGGSDYKDSPLAGKCFGADTDAFSSGSGSRQGCWPSL